MFASIEGSVINASLTGDVPADQLLASHVRAYRAGERCTARRQDGLLCLDPGSSSCWPWPLCSTHRQQLERAVMLHTEEAIRGARKRHEQEYVANLRELRQELAATHVVYFIQRESDRAVKIGYTSRLSTRLGVLRAHNGPIHIVGLREGSIDLEARMHKQLAKWRLGRTEWFEPSAAVMRAARASRHVPSERFHGRNWRRGLGWAA